MDERLLGTWGATTLLAIACSVWYPIVRERWLRRAALHVAAATAIALVSGLVGSSGVAPWRTPPWSRTNGIDPGTMRAGTWRPGGPPPMARVALIMALYGLAASATHAVMATRHARTRDRQALVAEARLAQAQLSALQMQLNPHFLFNALNGIAALMHSDLNAADRMLGDLSELLRLALDTTDTPTIPLSRELAFLDRYLAIEQARYGDRLVVARHVDPSVLDASVPTLILQPLVENAIRHGVEPSRAPAEIRLTAWRDGGTLHLTIANTSVPPLSPAPAAGGHGIGLSNTRARLAQLYPGVHTFDLESVDTGGTVVRLSLPYHTVTPASPAAVTRP